jgi:predicted ATP-binding protein involved in virulence
MPQKKNNSNNSEKPQNAYFLSLELENIRCFREKQKIDFSDDNGKLRQWTVILGDNGTGKTTILQNLIAMLPTTDIHGNMLVTVPNIPLAFLDIRTLEEGPSSKFYLGARYTLQSNLKDTGKKISLTAEKQEVSKIPLHKVLWQVVTINCLAYGASRKAGETSLSEQNVESTYITLFDETVLLINPEEWLLQADYFVSRSNAKKSRENFRRVKEVLINVLPDVDNIRIGEMNIKEKSFPIPAVEFHTPYGWVEAKNLSLGYRTSMAWMVDFASRMFDLYPDSENPLAEPAVVLIDEIDLHLHPKWQRELLDYLSNLFPNTQFIVTTHSPLIVQSAAARDANIVVCRREGDHVVIDQSLEAVKGWRADQILTSDLFDLPSTRDIQIEKLEKQRRAILSKPKLTKADENKLRTLAAELDALPVNEETEDDKAMDIIRRAAQYFQNEKS